MLTLIREGGFPMFIILAFGLTALVAAVRYAIAPDARRDRRGFIRAMAAATMWSSLAGFAADMSAVLRLSNIEMFSKEPQWYFIALKGFAESLSPLLVGFPMLALVSLLVAVGRSREAPSAG